MSLASDLETALRALDKAEDFILTMPKSPERQRILGDIDLALEVCESGRYARRTRSF